MKPLIDFWKKDIINKLIVIVSLALMTGVIALLVLIFNMPQGMSFGEVFSGILPARATPTFDVRSYLTPKTPAMIVQTQTQAPVLIPTFTPFIPPTEATLPASPTLTLEPVILPTATSQAANATATQPAVLRARPACLPDTPPQTGKVVEVVDGITARVYINKLVYVVRYIGIAAPADKNFADLARQKNFELTLGKELTLIPGSVDKDDRGRLLRYVLAGDLFINQEIISLGLGSAASDSPPEADPCAQLFSSAEASARASLLGMWKSMLPTPTP